MSAIAAMMGVAGTYSSVPLPLPTLDLNFDGQATSFKRASSAAAKTNGDQLATGIVTQGKGGSVQSMYMGPDGKLIKGYVQNIAASRDPNTLSLAGTVTPTKTTGQTAPDGSNDAVRFTVGSAGNFFGYGSAISFTAGKKYTLSCFVKAVTGTVSVGTLLSSHAFGGVFQRVQYLISPGAAPTLDANRTTGSGDYGIQDVGDGWYRMWVSATAVTTISHQGSQYVRVDDASSGDKVLFWGVQLEKDVSTPSTFIDATADQVARVEYDASGNPLGLLVEEQRTNLVPQSTGTAVAWPSSNWNASGYTGQKGQWGVSHNHTGTNIAFTTAPDGTNTAVRFNLPNHGYTVGRCFMGNSTAYTCANNATQTVSFWIRNRLSNSGNITMEPYIDNSVSRKTFTQSDMPQNQWVRLSYSFTNNTGSTIGTNRAAWDIELQQNVDHDFDLWGLQIEAAESATSYIPTNGSSKTRQADDITLATSNFGVDPANATLAVDFTLAGFSSTSNYPRVFELHAGSNNDRNMLIFIHEAQAYVGAEFVESGAGTIITAASSVTYPLSIAHAQRRDGTSGSVAVNGVLGSSAAITQGTTTPTELTIGQSLSHGQEINGHIRRLRYWPSALQNSLLKKASV